jgi:predicted DNA-binding protein
MNTLCLPVDVEQRLKILAKQRYTSKSDRIEEALERPFPQTESEKISYSLGEEHFGKYGGRDDI